MNAFIALDEQGIPKLYITSFNLQKNLPSPMHLRGRPWPQAALDYNEGKGDAKKALRAVKDYYANKDKVSGTLEFGK
jgi:hypothetical protein